MKYLLAILFVTSHLAGYSQLIDFETIGLNDGDPLAPPYNPITLSCDCEVTFLMGEKLPSGDYAPLPGPVYPRLIKVGPGAFDVFLNGTAGSECGVSPASTVDMPAPGQNLGCWMLATDVAGTTASAIKPIILEYSSPVFEAQGSIVDIDGKLGNYEGWNIIAFRKVGTTYIQGTTINLSAPGDGGDGIAADFTFTEQIDRIVIEYDPNASKTTNIGLAFDNFYPCSLPKTTPSATRFNNTFTPTSAGSCPSNYAGSQMYQTTMVNHGEQFIKVGAHFEYVDDPNCNIPNKVILATKFDSDGSVVWSHTLKRATYDLTPTGITIGHNPDESIITGTVKKTSNINSDIFAMKIDNITGNVIWIQVYSSSSGNTDVGSSVIKTVNGKYILIGQTTSIANAPLFMVKIDDTGTRINSAHVALLNTGKVQSACYSPVKNVVKIMGNYDAGTFYTVGLDAGNGAVIDPLRYYNVTGATEIDAGFISYSNDCGYVMSFYYPNGGANNAAVVGIDHVDNLLFHKYYPNTEYGLAVFEQQSAAQTGFAVATTVPGPDGYTYPAWLSIDGSGNNPTLYSYDYIDFANGEGMIPTNDHGFLMSLNTYQTSGGSPVNEGIQVVKVEEDGSGLCRNNPVTEAQNLTVSTSLGTVSAILIGSGSLLSASSDPATIPGVDCNNDDVSGPFLNDTKLPGQALNVYPNPSNGQVQIVGLQEGQVQVELIDALGKTVYQKMLTSTSQTLMVDLSHFPKGTFILNIRQNDMIYKSTLVRN